MPCTYFETAEEKAENARKERAKTIKPLKDQVNTLTALLCEATKVLASTSATDEDGKFYGNVKLLDKCSDSLRGWHKNHTKSDRERKQAATEKLIQAASDLGYDIEDARKLRDLLK